MVLTRSIMLTLGTKAPDFSLRDVTSDKTVSLADFAGKKALLVMFICRHCPYVRHVKDELTKLGKDYEKSVLGIVAISSNDINLYPEDAPDSLKEFAQIQDFRFPLLFDESQDVAKAYTAACTPDFFLFDRERKLVYRGQMDGSRPGNSVPVTGEDLRVAIEVVLNDRLVDSSQHPSTGCNIKWKPGNEPEYYKS